MTQVKSGSDEFSKKVVRLPGVPIDVFPIVKLGMKTFERVEIDEVRHFLARIVVGIFFQHDLRIL